MMKFNPSDFSFKKSLTIKQVVIRILCIELFIELLTMLMLSVIPYKFSPVVDALVDAILLVILTTPAIYFFVIRPFEKAHAEAIIHINHLAHTDELTKLANRRLVLEYLAVTATNNTRSHDFCAVLLLDLDEFKLINDNHGHDAGDALLINVGERLKNSVRGDDVVGRLGGDEYIVLLRKLGADDKAARYVAQLVANKLIKQIMTPMDYNGNTLLVSASIGMRLFSTEADAHKIIGDAETAMYRAKDNGKGCAVFFDE
jgi:two-component system, cell cycle response regulator